MKKELKELLKSEQGTLKINSVSVLRRWTKDALGTNVDKLVIEFSITRPYDYSYEIKSRDTQGIVSEIMKHQTEAFTNASDTLNRRLRGGELG